MTKPAKKVLGFKEGGHPGKALTTGNHKMGGAGAASGKVKKKGTKVAVKTSNNQTKK